MCERSKHAWKMWAVYCTDTVTIVLHQNTNNDLKRRIVNSNSTTRLCNLVWTAQDHRVHKLTDVTKPG